MSFHLRQSKSDKKSRGISATVFAATAVSLFLAGCNMSATGGADSAPVRAQASQAVPEQPINRKLSPDETLQRIPVQTGVATTVNGKINGYKANVHAVTIGAGQSLNVKFDTRSTSAYFNVIDGADASGAAVHRGEVAGNIATVTATRPTTYLIQRSSCGPLHAGVAAPIIRSRSHAVLGAHR
jgi:hypothetical protein